MRSAITWCLSATLAASTAEAFTLRLLAPTELRVTPTVRADRTSVTLAVLLRDDQGSPVSGPVRIESDCIEETVCLSGALPGRSELVLRIVGPKPNGNLWPTLVRFSTSTIDVWITQTSTGIERHYRLEGASPSSSDLSGLFDRGGFTP